MHKIPGTENKVFWADNLRAFATISVILLHVSAPILYQYGTIPNRDWWIGNFVDSSVRFCVPVFLMLSGALILPKTYELGVFFRKRISRIFLPFVFWSFIYILYNLISKKHGVNLNTVELIQYILIQFRKGASYHLWYIYMIIGIYLFIPIISKWIVNSTKKEISYYIVIWFIVILISLPFLTKIKPEIDLRYFSGFLGYPILGFLLATTRFPEKKIKLLSFFLFLTGISITIIGTYLLTKSNGRFYGGFYSFLSPNVIVASTGVFLFLKHFNFKNEWFTNLTKFISKYSYGIYLAHVFVLIHLSKIGISWSFINPLIGIPLTTLLCLIISSIITFLINRSRYGTYISG
ncbi:acyltransferase family protein [Pedobacter sp. P351]|uniref:acyltransferase n=1 Tax=Pedobacter superstes TaxID=3133441 RepID=UPI0030949D86